MSCWRSTAGAYSFEAGNVRHEHEWRVWEDVKLPDGKFILPGVVSHATNVVEHPELVAERIVRFANLVGRERVIAATDCGLGGRVHRGHRLGEARGARPGCRAGQQTALAVTGIIRSLSSFPRRRAKAGGTQRCSALRWVAPAFAGSARE